MQKATEILPPYISQTPTKLKKNEAITAPVEGVAKVKIKTDVSPSTHFPKNRGRSPKSKLTTPKTKKSPAKKVNSGRKATPENNNKNGDSDSKSRSKTPPSAEASSANKRKRRYSTPTQVSPSKPNIDKNKTSNKRDIDMMVNEKSDRDEKAFPSEEKRKIRKAKRIKNLTTEMPSMGAIVFENEDATMDGPGQESSSTATTSSLRLSLKKKKPRKKENPITLNARVHRLRHMGYIPGSVAALTPTSTEDGQIVVARTDGSYELKSITLSSTTGLRYSDNLNTPKHRLITIAETAPTTGPTSFSDHLDDDNDSNIEDSSNNGLPEPCSDAASSLCWIYPSSTPICVGSGPNGNIWIVDFKHLRPINVVSSGGGGIFDLATCKFQGDGASCVKPIPFVAGACEDGSVRIWRIALGSAGQGKIQDPPLVTLPSAGAPILSLAWKNVTVLKQGRTTTFQTVVFAAVADGTIRKYGLDIEEQNSSINEFDDKNNVGKLTDSHNNHYTIPNPPKSILRMTIENKGRKDPTKVWTLLLLQDDTLVVGTSLGQVQFWNGETGTLSQTVIQSNSQADVLKIVVNLDETKLFCSGVDSRVVCLERKKLLTATSPPSSELSTLVTSHLPTYRPWKMTISQRPHTHDVKAMAIVTSSSNMLSSSIQTLLTGGLDTKICSYSVSNFAHTQPQTWYPWPSAASLFSSTTCAPKSHPKFVSMQRHDRIELYLLETLAMKKNANRSKYLKQGVAQYPASIPVATIQLGRPDGGDDDNERIMSSSLSPLQASSLSSNGRFLAVSNASSTYVFHLNYTHNDEGSVRLQPEKLELPEGLQNVSATTFLFTNDELYVGDSSGNQKVHILRLPSKNRRDDENRMDVKGENDCGANLSVQTVSVPESQQSNIADEILLPIQSIHARGEFMVTSSHARENAIHIFRRRTSKASYEHFWTMPNLGGWADARPAAVALLDKKRLAVATYRSHLYLLDIETRSLNKWSEQYGFPIREKKWTEDSLCGRGYPLRLMPQQNGRLVMASFGTFCIINLNEPMPRRCRRVPRRPAWKNRRKFKPIVHNDDDDDDVDSNDDYWLEPRVTRMVEDEYSHNDPDADDDDATENNNLSKSPLKQSTNIIRIPQAIPDDELVSRNCTICSHYKNMLYMDFLGPKEMIIVEQPWSEIAETFPAALQRRIYGAD